MIYTYNELFNKYGSRYNIKKAIDNKEVYKIERGIYSDKKTVDPLVLYSKKYPSGVITMDSAFYFYDLTDVIPSKVFLATSSKYRTIKNKKITQIFTDKNVLDVGIDEIKIGKNKINIYNKERLLVELIRKRKRLPFDYYKEIVSNYRMIVDELDMEKIEEYLSLFKNDLILSEALQREVF